MPWKQREDIAESEPYFVMADVQGRPLGYFQHLPDGSASYWLERPQQARAVRSPDDARDRILERFFPLRVVSVDEKGERRENERFRWSTAYTESRFFVGAVLNVARRCGGELEFVDTTLGLNVRRRIKSVQVIGNDGTVIDEDPV